MTASMTLQFFASLNWAEWVFLCIAFGLFDLLAVSTMLAVSALVYRAALEKIRSGR
jgi:hypothetical protein